MSESRWISDHARQLAIAGTWMRGGTSKCWVFHRDQLPDELEARDAVLVRLFGSPDHRQIDGVGGGTSTTSKVLVVDSTDAHSQLVRYEVGQVSVDTARVEWASNCGNCAAALALYAVQERLIPATRPTSGVTLVNQRTGLVLEALVDSADPDHPPRDGAEIVPGTVFPGVRVRTRWTPPSWSEYGRTFPTGNQTDVLDVHGRRLRGTLIDAGAPAVLVSAADLGVQGTCPTREQVEALLPLLADLRGTAAEAMSLPRTDLQSVPKVGVVGLADPGSGSDLEARMVSMTAPHPAIGITSAVAVAAAAGFAGTIVNGITSARAPNGPGTSELTIGTLAGAVPVEIEYSTSGEALAIGCVRSARRIVDGSVHVGADWAEVRDR